MHETDKIQVNQSTLDVHAAMGHNMAQGSNQLTDADLNSGDDCCDDCSCAMSTCQNQFGLTNNSDYSFTFQDVTQLFYSNLLTAQNTPTLPYRPPII